MEKCNSCGQITDVEGVCCPCGGFVAICKNCIENRKPAKCPDCGDNVYAMTDSDYTRGE